MASGVNFNHFEDIANGLEPALSGVVRKTAFDIQAGYQGNAARDTGFMANSAYVVTSEESTYGQGGGAAPKDAYLLPPVEAPSEKTVAYVGVGASYAIFPELGTRFMPAQPAFYPAVDAAQPGFQAACDAVMSKLGGK